MATRTPTTVPAPADFSFEQYARWCTVALEALANPRDLEEIHGVRDIDHTSPTIRVEK
jgi:hypothetical protein